MGEPAKRHATYEDVLRAPAHMVAEVIDGELVLSPRPGPSHALATGELFGELRDRFGRRGGGWLFLFEPELHFGPEHAPAILVPDIAGWRRSTMATIPDTAFLDVAPDWVCETLSASTEKFDRGGKLHLYAEHGVGHAWLVNPDRKMLEVYRQNSRQPPRWELLNVYRDDAKVTDEPFTDGEFVLDLGGLWAAR